MSTGSVSMLYEGTLTTLLAASVGHYPWFYVYNYLDGTLGAESGSQLALTDMFASVRQQWNNTQLTTLGSVTSIAAAMTSFFGGLWHDLTHAYTAIGQWAFSHWIWDNKVGVVWFCVYLCTCLL